MLPPIARRQPLPLTVMVPLKGGEDTLGQPEVADLLAAVSVRADWIGRTAVRLKPWRRHGPLDHLKDADVVKIAINQARDGVESLERSVQTCRWLAR